MMMLYNNNASRMTRYSTPGFSECTEEHAALEDSNAADQVRCTCCCSRAQLEHSPTLQAHHCVRF